MKKSILAFGFFLLSLGVILNYDIVVNSDTNHGVNLGIIINDANANGESGGGGTYSCLYYRNGSTSGVYCGTCLQEDCLWDSGYRCSA